MSPHNQRLRLPHKRSRNGCIVCRKRHKRCDEVKPQCGGCSRNELLCRWPQSCDGTGQALNTEGEFSQVVSRPETPHSLALGKVWTGDSIPKSKLLQIPLFQGDTESRLLDHFVHSTASRLAGKKQSINPFLNYNLQLAEQNEALQHALLAVSASHLLYSQPDLVVTAKSHYAVSIRSLKHSLTGWDSMTYDRKLIALATTLALCWFEVVDCNANGALYRHLAASKTMLNELVGFGAPNSDSLIGFFLEQYAYLAVISVFTPDPEPLYQEALNTSLCSSLRLLNYGTPIYGCLLGYAHHFFEAIPRISILAREVASTAASCPPQLEPKFVALYEELESWEVSAADDDISATDLIAAARVYQQASMIFLLVAFHGPGQPSQQLLDGVEPCIENFLESFSSLTYDPGPWTTICWPLMMVGSCMRNRTQRELAQTITRRSVPTFRMFCQVMILDVLQALWREQDDSDDFWGPYGIQRLLKTKNLTVSMG